MKGKPLNTIIHLLLPILLGVIALVIVIALLKGITLPLINTPLASLVALFVIGLAMCLLGGVGQIGTNGRWNSPPAIIGTLLGLVILIIFISALTGWHLPLISGEIHGVVAIGILITIKLIFGIACFFFNWL